MQTFEAKQKALFACLDEAEKDIKGTGLDQKGLDMHTINVINSLTGEESEVNPQCSDKSIFKLRGKKSIFKTPELPITRCLKPKFTPDYQVNPHKWKKYSLSDVDTSDQTNKSAALTFLKQMAEKKEDDETATTPLVEEKIKFKKTNKTKRSLKGPSENFFDEESEKPTLKGSKLIMPEYVIGKKFDTDHKKRRMVTKQSQQDIKQLKLHHLLENDEDTND